MKSKKEIYNEDDAPGLDAINSKERELYGNQEQTHFATVVSYELGGEDPLWAIDCFVSNKQQKHFHYITLGFTDLWYDEDFAEDETNGFGFELTFRYAPFKGDKEIPIWPVNFLQNIAKYVLKSGNVFDDFHRMSANGPIFLGYDTEITALVFYTDPEMGEIETPHGPVKFLQVYGITTQEYTEIREQKYGVRELIDKHKVSNPLLITDLARK